MTNAIQLERVTKTFGPKVAVRELSLAVPTGAVYGFIGPNGAGKTTTLRMVMSILFPDSGQIEVLGHGSALDAKDRIGYLPEERGVYKKMRVGAFLRHMGRLKGIDGPDLGRRVTAWLERVGLGDVERKKCEELSKGMQQKIQFVATVIHEPELLILDEPFSGLDPINMRLLRELITEQHSRGATIIFSTHVMVHAEQICDHVVMIADGNKVLDDSLETIRSRFDPHTILFEPLTPGADRSALNALPELASVAAGEGRTLELTLADGVTAGAAMAAVAGAMPASRIELHRPTLEDIFVQIVTGAAAPTAKAQALRAALRSGDPASDPAHGAQP